MDPAGAGMRRKWELMRMPSLIFLGWFGFVFF
jgi:hypothetical protein